MTRFRARVAVDDRAQSIRFCATLFARSQRFGLLYALGIRVDAEGGNRVLHR